MATYGVVPDVFCFTPAMAALRRAGRVDDALALLTRMRACKVEPNSFTYSALISACADAGRWEDAIRLVGEMRLPAASSGLGAGIDPPPFVWASVVHACGARLEPALALIRDMRAGLTSSGGAPFDASAPGAVAPFNSLLGVCGAAGEWEMALDLLDKLRRRDTPARK